MKTLAERKEKQKLNQTMSAYSQIGGENLKVTTNEKKSYIDTIHLVLGSVLILLEIFLSNMFLPEYTFVITFAMCVIWTILGVILNFLLLKG